MLRHWRLLLLFPLGIFALGILTSGLLASGLLETGAKASEIPVKITPGESLPEFKTPAESKKITLDVTKDGAEKKELNPEPLPILEELGRPKGSERISFNAEYLMWWMKGDKIAPLSTTGTTGILNAPGTSVLFGDDAFGGEMRSGARFNMNYWLSKEHNLAFEANFLFLETQVEQINLASPGAPLLARPFNNVSLGVPSAQILSSPSTTAGAFNSTFDSKLWGAEGNLKYNFINGASMTVDGLFGFRYLGLKESLDITGSSFNPLPSRVISASTDNFKTNSDFYGGQIGANIQLHKDRWFVNVIPKLAIGSTQQSVNITGITSFTNGTTSSTAPTGFLAADTNIGQYSKEKFSFVPELGVNLGYTFQDWIRAYAGYNVIYWSSVSRPGSTVDLNVGNGQPAFSFNSTDLWLQGITLGIELSF